MRRGKKRRWLDWELRDRDLVEFWEKGKEISRNSIANFLWFFYVDSVISSVEIANIPRHM
jgi:hypothetical protein